MTATANEPELNAKSPRSKHANPRSPGAGSSTPSLGRTPRRSTQLGPDRPTRTHHLTTATSPPTTDATERPDQPPTTHTDSSSSDTTIKQPLPTSQLEPNVRDSEAAFRSELERPRICRRRPHSTVEGTLQNDTRMVPFRPTPERHLRARPGARERASAATGDNRCREPTNVPDSERVAHRSPRQP